MKRPDDRVGMSRERGQAGLALLVTLALLLTSVGVAWAGIGDYRCTDPGRVYLGNPRLIRTPSQISADRIYKGIPEYQKIVDERLTDKDVRYHFLMKKASARFAKAVKAMARAKSHDFVAEIGAIEVVKKDAKSPPDRTQEVIDRLSE